MIDDDELLDLLNLLDFLTNEYYFLVNSLTFLAKSHFSDRKKEENKMGLSCAKLSTT